MFRHRLISKLTAIFVTAFICLNAGGALCVAYCQTFDITAEPEHCPLKKTSEHCDKKDQQNNESYTVASAPGEMDCCPLTFSFLAAPVESKTFSFDSIGPVLVQEFSFTPAFFASQKIYRSDIAYRGPPPLDRRVDRLKHCIIRI